MKKLIYILGLSLGLVACDLLDQDPSTQLPTGSIQTVEDLATAVNGIYYVATFGDMGTLGSELALYADLKGGDVTQIGNSTQVAARIANNSITPADSFNFYYYLYAALANVNMALQQAEALDDAGKEVHIAELYALRGWLHFELARIFAPIPTAGNTENTMGVVLSDRVFEITHVAPRASLEDTYKQIVDDLSTAIDMGAAVADYKKRNTGHLNYWAALGLRARAYLYWGKYPEAKADCDEIIDEGTDYSLYTLDNYAAVWGNEGTSEMLLELLQTDTYNAQRYAPGYYASPEGYAECAMTEAFHTFLTADAGDVRAKLVARLKTAKGANEGYYPLKYPGNTGSSSPLYANNIKVLRLSEIYLIAAEAALKSSASADDYINTLRRNRIADYADVAGVTLDDVLDERRKELFAENHAAFDLWRNRRDVVKGGTTIACTDYRTVTPIPTEEINVSGGLLIQNPHWGN